MKTIQTIAISIAILASSPAWCDVSGETKAPGSDALATIIKFVKDTDNSKWLKTFTLEPKILQAKDGSSPSLGLAYKLYSRPLAWDLVEDAAPGDPVPTVAENIGALEFSVKGMYASKREVNVEDVVDAMASGSWNYGLYGTPWVFKTAFSGGYEQQQGGSTSSSRCEISQTAGTIAPKLGSSELVGRVAYARVDPIRDTARKAVLTTEPEPYNRYEIELFAIVPVNMGNLQKIEVRHLRFKEPGAPASVKAAALDQSKLSSIYFSLPNHVFVAYSKGGVPADRKDSQILQIGWSSSGI